MLGLFARPQPPDHGQRDAEVWTFADTTIEQLPVDALGRVPWWTEYRNFALGTIVTNPESHQLAGPEIAMLQLHEGPFQEAALRRLAARRGRPLALIGRSGTSSTRHPRRALRSQLRCVR
jgi:hypothetical protein